MQGICLTNEQKAALQTLPPAAAYVPEQAYETPFSPEEGLKAGTIWRALYQPYGEENA